MRPVVALDVDGVLFPLGARPGDPILVPEGYIEATVWGMPVSYHPDLPAFLAQVHELAEIVWATSWAEGANGHIGPLFGLDARPTLDVRGDRWAAVSAFADERPLVWCEDMPLSRADRTALKQRNRITPTLRITPRRDLGLTARHHSRILRFLRELHDDA